MFNVFLEFAIDIILHQILQLESHPAPVLSRAGHIHIIDATAQSDFPLKLEKFLNRVHQYRGRNDFMDTCCGRKVTYKIINDPIDCVLADLFHYFLEEEVPLFFCFDTVFYRIVFLFDY